MPALPWSPPRAGRRTDHQVAAERLAAVRLGAERGSVIHGPVTSRTGWVPGPPTVSSETVPFETVPFEALRFAPAPSGPAAEHWPSEPASAPLRSGPDVGEPDPDGAQPTRRSRGRRAASPPAPPAQVTDTLLQRLTDRAPVALRGARWSVQAAAAAALLALAVVVAVVLVVRTGQTTPGVPVPVRPAAATTGQADTETAGTAGAAPDSTRTGSASGVATSPTAAAPTGEVVVHVVGRVGAPGLVRVPGGSRVDDAIRAAGGATAEADLGALNLARPVVDGEQVHVPAPGEPVQVAAGAAGHAGVGSSVPPAPPGSAGGLLDLNTAALADLDALPGIGPVLAQRILDWRAENGRFTSVDELGEVSGIGDAVLGRLRPLVRV